MAISIDARKQSMKNEWNQLVNKPSFFNYHMDLKKAHNKNLNIERGSADFFSLKHTPPCVCYLHVLTLHLNFTKTFQPGKRIYFFSKLETERRK